MAILEERGLVVVIWIIKELSIIATKKNIITHLKLIIIFTIKDKCMVLIQVIVLALTLLEARVFGGITVLPRVINL